jgi:hypothetical protein
MIGHKPTRTQPIRVVTTRSGGANNDPFPNNSDQGDNTYCVIPMFINIGVDESLLSDLIEEVDDSWPKGNWNRLKS